MTHGDLQAATRRLVRTVDTLDDPAYAGPSLLPGWTRAHVVAHLALNAEALAGSVRGVIEGESIAMYPNSSARDEDIAVLGAASPTVLRTRLYGATTTLADVLASLAADRSDVVVERTPGSERTFRAGDVAAMRISEVEIHHADLDAGYSRLDWPGDTSSAFIDRLRGRAAATLVAADLGRTWKAEHSAPIVTGTAAALAWWLTGRGAGDGLTTDGELPGIETW